MRVHYLQHGDSEGPAMIGQWALERGYEVTGTHLHEGQELPAVEEPDWLVIMGGAMNVYEYRNHPWLLPEKRFISSFMESGKPVIGVCLGAQLIADVCGYKVYQNRDLEIGWYPVRMLPAAKQTPLFAKFPAELVPLHWHGDTFDLPREAIRIAESEACANQAFTIGECIVGLQFHIEVGEADLDAFVGEGWPSPGRYIQTREEILRAPEDLAGVHKALYGMLDALTKA